MKNPIIFDCDGVLLDWETGFRNWSERHYAIQFKTPRPTHWDLEQWTGRSKEETMFMVTRFNRSDDFGQLDVMPHAVEVLAELSGHPLFVLSSCSRMVKGMRWNNLIARFGDVFQSVICLDLQENKSETLGKFYSVFGECIWVEDNVNNAKAGWAEGHEAFLLRCSHNSATPVFEGITTLDTLSDLLSHIS
jgi:beta-phosphoglucomutase-like phosphatase (HAD superfamily)